MDHPFLELLSGDKRKIKRIVLPKPVQTTLSILGKKIPVTLFNYSHQGMGLVVPNDNKIKLVESQLIFPGATFDGQLVYQQTQDSELIQVGFALPQDQKQKFHFRFDDPDWDLVKDVETVKNIYDDLVFKSFECPVEVYQHGSMMTFYPLQLTDSGTLIGEIKEHKQGQVQKGEGFCNFLLFQTYHVFQTTVLKLDDKKIEVKLAPTINRLLRRETLRIEKDERDYQLKITLKSKILNQTYIDDQVLDYSEHGISLIDNEQQYAFPKGMPIEEITIAIQGREEIQGSAKVRNYAWNPDKQAYILGLHFEAGGEPHLTNWHNFILKARYPNLDFDYKDEDHPKIWELFDRSGYSSDKPIDNFEYIYEMSSNTWMKCKGLGNQFSKKILIRGEDKLLGHLQMDKIYPRTWAMHQLAIDPSLMKTVLKEIYSVTTDSFIEDNTEFLFALTDATKKWNQRNYYDFFENHLHEDETHQQPYLIFEAVFDESVNLLTSDPSSVRKSSKFDLKYILNYFDNRFPKMVNEAYEFHNDPFLDDFNKKLEKNNLSRKREFLSLLDKQKLIAFAQMEFGTDALNIYNFFDIVYIHQIEEDIPTSKLEPLIKEVIEFYKSVGKKSVTIMIENADKDLLVSKGLKFLFNEMRWITKSIHSRKYQSYINSMYGHLLLRREKIKEKNKKKNEN